MAMTEQEKAISQLCIAIQGYCNGLCVDHNFLIDSYNLGCIERCVDRIHKMVNPDFDKTCESTESFEREENDHKKGKVCSMCHRACIVQYTSEQFEDDVFCCEVCMERFIKLKQSKQICAWCGQTGNMQFASKCKPSRYFCNERCLKSWSRFNTKPR